MNKIKLNETPVRTSRNFKINNIKLENIEFPERIEDFKNVQIMREDSKIKIDDQCSYIKLNYGLSDFLTNQVRENANQKICVKIDGKTEKDVRLYFDFDEDNLVLVEDIEILAGENARGTVIIKYECDEDLACFHNGILRVNAKKGARVNVVFMNFINLKSNHFMAIENTLEENAKVNCCVIDLGRKK